MSIIIEDRASAGYELARVLLKYRKRHDVIVLALPRGGVPVGAAIARALHSLLDIMLVRKLGVPGHEELAMGAMASGGIRVLNEDIVTELRISDREIEQVTMREQAELDRRMKAYRGNRPWPDLAGKCVILVDDGVATGATMRAAIKALRAQRPQKVIVAVPVAPFQTLAHLRSEADEVVCLATPEPFTAISAWYASFPQLDDDEVRQLLAERWNEHDAPERFAAAPPPAPEKSGKRRQLAGSEPHELAARASHQQEVIVQAWPVALQGFLTVPGPAHGLVVFVHGSGSSRFSSRNRFVADYLNDAGLATLLFDLLAPEEARLDNRTGALRFDIDFLAARLDGAIRSVTSRSETRDLPLGLFGASTGAAVALNAAVQRPQQVAAVVSRGGRPDLATVSLSLVRSPTLLIVGSLDDVVIAFNREAAAELECEHRFEIVNGASHLFQEPGTLEEVARVARAWFEDHLLRAALKRQGSSVET